MRAAVHSGNLSTILTCSIVLFGMLLPPYSASAGAKGGRQASTDHRPACTDARCRAVASYLKVHYCGDSPFGEGPEDSCDLRVVGRKASPTVNAIADFVCDWDEKKEDYACHQAGDPPAPIRSVLERELKRLGLPSDAKGKTRFQVWEAKQGGLTLAAASYSRIIGSNLELCQVIVALSGDSQVLVLRELPFQETDADVPQTTEWSPVDLADVDECGKVDIVLEGDAYEDHWLEVVSVHDGKAETIFSGLGYYL